MEMDHTMKSNAALDEVLQIGREPVLYRDFCVIRSILDFGFYFMYNEKPLDLDDWHAVLCFIVKQQTKAQLLKITAILFLLIVLWVDWFLLGSPLNVLIWSLLLWLGLNLFGESGQIMDNLASLHLGDLPRRTFLFRFFLLAISSAVELDVLDGDLGLLKAQNGKLKKFFFTVLLRNN